MLVFPCAIVNEYYFRNYHKQFVIEPICGSKSKI